MGERPGDPVPAGCFSQVVGRPVTPTDLDRVWANGIEPLCRFFRVVGLDEQARYKLLRCFFSLSFREFKALERRVGKDPEPGAASDPGRV